MLERLRKIFIESGKSQTEIAKKVNVTSAYIWKILNKDNVKPRDLFIQKVCEEFGINKDWLLTGEGEPTKKTDITFGEMCADIGINDPKAKEAISKYYELSPEDKELWWKFMERFTKGGE